MKTALLLFISITTATLPLAAWDSYSELLKNHPELAAPGSIEIVVDPAKVDEIRQKQYERLREKGIPADQASKWTKVGEIAEDNFYLWIRDAVIFPNGTNGLYDRIFTKAALNGNIGAAVLPIFSNGDVGVIAQFRHATRSWELELPRGSGTATETPLESAKRELKEESGLEAEEWVLLGKVAPDTGILQSTVPVFLAKKLKEGDAAHETSEVISKLIRLPMKTLNAALKEGKIELEIQKVKTDVKVRDSFLTYALYLASLQ